MRMHRFSHGMRTDDTRHNKIMSRLMNMLESTGYKNAEDR